MPKAWDRAADGPADASHDADQADAVYEYLLAENGSMTAEGNAHRTRWADSPIWSVVNGPWRLKSYTEEGVVTFVPNEHYSGPNPARLDEFRQIPTSSDEHEYELLGQRPGGIQVGFLPWAWASSRMATPPSAGPTRWATGTPSCRRFCSTSVHAVEPDNPTVAGAMLRQPYVRQALQSCLDQDFASREIYQGYGWPQTGPVPLLPASDLVSPRLRDGRGFWPFDVDRARDLLTANGWDTGVSPAVCVDAEKAGVPEGTALSFLLRYAEGRPALTRLMEQFAVDAAKAGIELRLSEVYGSVLVVEDRPGPPTPDDPKPWEISTWNGGWIYDYPTGEALFQSGAAFNCSNYLDVHADELIDKSATSDDLDALYEYQEYISEQVPVLFLPNTPWRLFEVASSLRGFTPINPYGMVNPENWYYVEEAS